MIKGSDKIRELWPRKTIWAEPKKNKVWIQSKSAFTEKDLTPDLTTLEPEDTKTKTI